MKDKLYRIMDWPKIEAIVYAEESHPQSVLGRHFFSGYTLFQAFIPNASEVYLMIEGVKDSLQMDLADEEGFFAVTVPLKEQRNYQYRYLDKDGQEHVIYDPYDFNLVLSDEEKLKWDNGILYNAYEFMGAHERVIRGVKGVSFMVWAPNALRVSVVGDFNGYNGKCNPMEKCDDTGIFSIFIPNLSARIKYKYEIYAKGGISFQKSDPYAFIQESPSGSSIICKEPKIKWTDSNFLKRNERNNKEKSAINIYQINLDEYKDDDGKYLSYHAILEILLPYLKDMRYTHIEIMPIMESRSNNSCGYQMLSLYSVNQRHGTLNDFMHFINRMHEEGIGVILEWIPSYFAKDEQGLSFFDGTYLYGHLDERKRYNVAYDAYMFNYARPQIVNYLISNALYWVRIFHVDGLHFTGISSMLYLDYAKSDGEWVANLYGGNENLEAIEFIKHINSILHKENREIFTLTKETSAWPKITTALDDNGLGFDFVWDNGFGDSYLDFIGKDCDQRLKCMNEITDSMVYAYSEDYILTMSNEDLIKTSGSLYELMPEDEDEKLKNIRLTLSFYMCHPGKKLIFMGQEALGNPDSNIAKLSMTLNKMYVDLPALHDLDRFATGFEWINCIDHGDGIISFLRKDDFFDHTIFVVCNFSDKEYPSYKFGVPYEGKYKMIFCSEEKQFGGICVTLSKVKETKEEEFDGRNNSLTLKVLPLSIAFYQYTPYSEEELLQIAEKKVQKIKEKLEKEAIQKAKKLKNLSLKEELETKVNEADLLILKGKEVQKQMKVTSKRK